MGIVCEMNTFLYARLKNGTYYGMTLSICPSVCLSVCLSVRPGFRTFVCAPLVVSFSNFRNMFLRWDSRSSSCFATIRLIWPTLWPKRGQTWFLQSWLHFSLFFFQIWDLECLWWFVSHIFRVLPNFEILIFYGFFCIFVVTTPKNAFPHSIFHIFCWISFILPGIVLQVTL